MALVRKPTTLRLFCILIPPLKLDRNMLYYIQIHFNVNVDVMTKYVWR